jgi:hypothetical protein
MQVSLTASNAYSVSVNNASNIFVNPSDFFLLFTQDNQDYFKSIVANSSAPVELEMTFTGVTMVNFGPVGFNMSTGQDWYWMKPITDAITNGTQNVSGFKFSPNPQIDFSLTGPFGYLTGVGISNYPSVKIVSTGENYKTVAKALQQAPAFGILFLDVPLGNPSQSAYLSSSQINAADSSVTLTLNPPPELVAGQSVTSVGWVLGVQTIYPAS